ncbi:MAG: DNA-3-methyladenine glycosylase [Halobacteriales archaeon]
MPADPYARLRDDPTLGPLLEEHGELSIGPAADTFERFTVAIINQQLSSTSAAAIRERVFERFEISPDGMAAADRDALRDSGLSGQKIDYIKNIAEAYRTKGLGVEYFDSEPDAAVVDELTAIKGIGPWTAKMYLIFCLGREDVFPVEDLGIRKGMRTLFAEEMTREEMVDAADAWRPFRSYASRYIWRVSDG